MIPGTTHAARITTSKDADMFRRFPNSQMLTRCVRLCTLLAVCLVLAGCNQLVILGYLIGGPPSIEPMFTQQTGKDMKDYGVTVAVVCTAPQNLKWNHNDIDTLVAEAVAYQLGEHNIQVIYPDQVRAWLDKNPDWTTPTEIGEYFDVTYVIHIDMLDYSLFVKNSSTLLKGDTRCEINVWEMGDDGEGEKIYSQEQKIAYPLRVPRSTQDTSVGQFKKEFLYRLSFVIGRHFFEYYTADDIGDAT